MYIMHSTSSVAAHAHSGTKYQVGYQKNMEKAYHFYNVLYVLIKCIGTRLNLALD